MEPAQNVDITINNTGIYGGSMKYGDKMLKMVGILSGYSHVANLVHLRRVIGSIKYWNIG